MNTYIKIQYPNIYYFNLDILGILFKKLGGNGIYYISEYKSKILKLSNKCVRFDKKTFYMSKSIKELLSNLDSVLLNNGIV
jgi:hypothetical protein